MNIVNESLAASALAVTLLAAVPNLAGASEKALLNPVQVAKANGLTILAEGEKKSHHQVKADKNWLQIGPSTYNSESRGFDEPWPFGPERNPQ
jgi:hypothetical protein